MGLIAKVLGAGAGAGVGAVSGAVREVAEVFTPNATRALELSAEAQKAALSELGAEFAAAGQGRFYRIVNGLNRLPRPFLALGTVGLFAYAMADPVGFAQRMMGLNAVPEPLWWLLGAVVAFYFGARETHYARAGRVVALQAPLAGRPAKASDNAALDDWRAGR